MYSTNTFEAMKNAMRARMVIIMYKSSIFRPVDILEKGGYNLPMKRTHMFLPEPLLKELKALAKRLDISVAELARQAIEEFLAKRRK